MIRVLQVEGETGSYTPPLPIFERFNKFRSDLHSWLSNRKMDNAVEFVSSSWSDEICKRAPSTNNSTKSSSSSILKSFSRFDYSGRIFVPNRPIEKRRTPLSSCRREGGGVVRIVDSIHSSVCSKIWMIRWCSSFRRVAILAEKSIVLLFERCLNLESKLDFFLNGVVQKSPLFVCFRIELKRRRDAPPLDFFMSNEMTKMILDDEQREHSSVINNEGFLGKTIRSSCHWNLFVKQANEVLPFSLSKKCPIDHRWSMKILEVYAVQAKHQWNEEEGEEQWEKARMDLFWVSV